MATVSFMNGEPQQNTKIKLTRLGMLPSSRAHYPPGAKARLVTRNSRSLPNLKATFIVWASLHF